MIKCACPKCGKDYDIKDEHAGKRTVCNKCRTPFTVPDDDVDDVEEVVEKHVTLVRDKPRPTTAILRVVLWVVAGLIMLGSVLSVLDDVSPAHATIYGARIVAVYALARCLDFIIRAGEGITVW